MVGWVGMLGFLGKKKKLLKYDTLKTNFIPTYFNLI